MRNGELKLGSSKIKTLGELCVRITDGTHRTPSYQESGVIFISAKNIKDGQIDLTDRKYISPDEHNFLTKTAKPQSNDLLLTKSGSLGDAAVIPELDFEFSIFESLALLKLRKEIIDPHYLHQYIRSLASERYFHGITTGLAVKHLHLGDLRKLKVPVPTLAVQRKIASILRTWDEVIEKLEVLKSTKDHRFRWLQKRLINCDFNSYSDFLSQYTTIPTLEKITRIDDLRPLTVKLHCKGIVANGRDMSITLSETGRPYYRRQSGDLLIGRQNFHNGGFGLVPPALDGFIASNAITSLRIDASKIDPIYLFYFLSRKEYYLRIGHIMDGTGQKELSDKQIKTLPVSIPSLSKQKEVVQILNAAIKEISLISAEIEALTRQKRGLMEKLLTGEWRVKVDGDAHG